MPAAPRILIVRLSHLGDVVQTLPLFHALRAAHPTARIAWAVQPEFAGLLRGLPGLERTIAFERRSGASAWPKLARELEAFGADWAVDAQGNVKSALVTLASRAPRRSGYARVDWREAFGASSTTDACPAGVPGEHAVERLLRLARHVAPDGATRPRFDPDFFESELEAGERTWSELSPHPGGVLLHISPPEDIRSWPLAHFAALARARAERGPVVLMSGPAEAGQGRTLERELRHPRIRHVVGQRGLRELGALLTSAARRDVTFVGCDSGPMHLAWACGMRVVVLAGPQHESRTGPFSIDAEHNCVRAQPAPACAPCLRRVCRHPEGPVCMAQLSVDSVERVLDPVR